MNKEPYKTKNGNPNRKVILELGILFALATAVFAFSATYDVLEKLLEFLVRHEEWELDEILPLSLYLALALAFFSLRRWREAVEANHRLAKSNSELEKALSEIRELKGIIPICATCKNIRDDEGAWHKLETYVSEHSHAEFSHGICPDCLAKAYPEFAGDLD